MLHKHTFFNVEREHRLLHEATGVEVLPATVVESLKEEDKTKLPVEQLKAQLLQAEADKSNPAKWQEALSGLNEKVLAVIDDNLRLLEANQATNATGLDLRGLRAAIGTVRANNIAAEANPEAAAAAEVAAAHPEIPKTFIGQASKFASDVVTDFREGSAWTKAGYIGGAVVGFLAARWLWHKAFGDGEHDGFLKTSAKWTLSLAASVGAVVGVKGVLDWWNNKTSAAGMLDTLAGYLGMGGQKNPDGTPKTPDPNAPPTNLGTVLDATRDGAGGIAQSVTEYGTDAVATVNAASEFLAAVVENPTDALETWYKKGGTLLLTGGKFILYDNFGKPLVLDVEVVAQMIRYWTGNREQGDNIFLAWTAAGAAYLIPKRLMQMGAGMKPNVELSIKGVFTKSLTEAWECLKGPVTQVQDALAMVAILRDAQGLKALRLRLVSNNMFVNVGRRFTSNIGAVSSEAQALSYIEEMVRFQDDAKVMERFTTNSKVADMFSAADIEYYKDWAKEYTAQLQEYARTMDVTADTPELLKEMKRIGNLEVVEFAKELRAARTRVNVAAGLPADAPDVIDAALDAAARTGAGAADPTVVPGTTAADDALDAAARATTIAPDSIDAARVATSLPGGPRLPIATPLAPGAVVDDIVTVLPDGWMTGLDDLRSQYADDALEIFNRATERCAMMGMELADARKALQNPAMFGVLGEDVSGILKLNDVFKVHKLQGVQRVAEYVISLDALANPALSAKLLDESVLKAVAALDGPVAPGLLKFLGQADDLVKISPDVLAIVIREASTLANASHLMKGLYAFGVGAEFVSVYMDYKSWEEANKRVNDTINNLDATLTNGGFVKISSGGKVQRYRHQQTGMEVDLGSLEKSISALQNEELGTLVGGSALSALSLVPSIALGPAGLVILAAQLTLHAVGHVANYFNDAEFLDKTPTPVLALLTTAGTVGKSSKGVIDTYYSDKGLLSTGTETGLREKMFRLMFAEQVQSLAKQDPELAAEILQGQDITTLLHETQGSLTGTADFDAVLKPYIAARMFQRSHDGNDGVTVPGAGYDPTGGIRTVESAIRLNSSLTWDSAKNLSTYDHYFDWGENVDEQSLKEIMREAAILYAQHRREKRHLADAAAVRARLAAPRPAGVVSQKEDVKVQAQAEVERSQYQAQQKADAKRYIFGKPVAELPEDARGRTSVEKAVATYVAKLDALAKKGLQTRPQMVQEDPKAFVTTALPDGKTEVPLGSLSALSLRGGTDVPVEQAVRARMLQRAQEMFDSFQSDRLYSKPLSVEIFNTLWSYANALEQYPALDPDQWLRKQIYALKQYHQGGMLSGDAAARDTAFNNIRDNLRQHMRMLAARPEKGPTLEEMQKGDGSLDVEPGKNQFLPWVNGARSVEVNGTVYKALPGKTTTYNIPNVGTLVCEASVKNKFSECQWYVTTNSTFSGSCVIAARDSENATYLHKRAVRELSLREMYRKDGSLYYVREGYGGEYVPQADGTLFYTGGKSAKSGKEYSARTYFVGMDWERAGYKFNAKPMWFTEGEYAKPYEGNLQRYIRIQPKGAAPKAKVA